MGFDLSAYLDPQYLLRVSEIIWINILLSGDNAVVIALACRSLPARQRFWGLTLGAAVAVGMRIGFSAIVTSLMDLPYVKLIGGCALLWIAVSLLSQNEQENGGPQIESSDNLLRAIKTIAVADLVMSLDNVIAVAAAAGGDRSLLIFGLAISVPLIVAGATVVMFVLARLPVLVWAGAGLLGWIAGDVVVSDSIVADNAELLGSALDHRKEEVFPILGAAGVIATGLFQRWRMREASQH
jgi:YjbE family integral membrane protein